jgi:nickel-dependent lactate racemase
MKIRLDYGTDGLEVSIPDRNIFSIGVGAEEPPIESVDEHVRKSLLNPIGSLPLPELCRNKKTACIVVSDKTRPVPNAILLPPILDLLEQRNITTTILIACGMHTPTEGAELEALLGAAVMERCEIINHIGDDESMLVNLGKCPGSDIDLVLNRRYMESDLRILTGFIEPHFMAGFSGGRKAVVPGIAGVQTMRYAHSPELLESPLSKTGILDGNPMHEFILGAARFAGVDFIVNVTLNRDKKITGVFSGDLDAAHRAGAAFCAKQSSVSIPDEADIVVTSNGGFPLDQDLYQTVKGMVSALPAVKPGGTIIIASACSKGIGSSHFREMLFDMKDGNSFIDMISKPGFFRVDQWEVEELVKVLRKAHVSLYTKGIPGSELLKCHVLPVDSVEQGISEALGRHGQNATITVLPSGPYQVPVVDATAENYSLNCLKGSVR